MGAPLARFLAEFSEERLDDKAVEATAGFEETSDLEPEPEPVRSEPVMTLTVASIANALREAREMAAAEERTRLEALMEARLTEQRAELTSAFEAARESWVNEEGLRISTSLAESVARLGTELATGAGNALRPLFAEAIRERILTEMRSALGSILGDPAHPPVRIEGPIDLLTAFGKTQTGDMAVDYVETEHAELTIITDQTRIESCFAACLAAFQLTEG
ncbi:MAG: hypothetical protein P4L76_11495 [Beijerinckiaceae bacterium]|nr:hypothetical protein [Beijerinckiaceae bacterium]